MIKSILKPRRAVSLTIDEETAVLELPDFCIDECYIVIDGSGTITAYEHRPFISGNKEYSNQCDSQYEEIAQYDGNVDDLWETIIEVREYNNSYSF